MKVIEFNIDTSEFSNGVSHGSILILCKHKKTVIVKVRLAADIAPQDILAPALNWESLENKAQLAIQEMEGFDVKQSRPFVVECPRELADQAQFEKETS